MKPSARLLAHLISSQPWAILETDPAWTMLQGLAAGTIAVELDHEAFAARMTAQSYRERLGAMKAGTVEIIPVHGILTQRWSWVTWFMDGTALDWLREAISEAIADPDVSAIVLDVDSPGGSVSGLTEFSADLRALRDTAGKPIVVVGQQIASAAYWTMCQANEVVVTPSGAVGSIGIVAIHQDISRYLDIEGVTITLIYSGQYKTEANPFQPLGEEALQQLQLESQHFYAMFLADVAKGRGTTASVVGETYGQARMVFPQPALAAGMVDRVDTLENTVRRLTRGRVAAGRPRAELDGPQPVAELVATSDGPDLQAIVATGVDAAIEGVAIDEMPPEEEPGDDDEVTAEPEPDAADATAPIPISSRRRDPAWVAANAAAFDQAAQNVAAPRWFERSSSR